MNVCGYVCVCAGSVDVWVFKHKNIMFRFEKFAKCFNINMFQWNWDVSQMRYHDFTLTLISKFYINKHYNEFKVNV